MEIKIAEESDCTRWNNYVEYHGQSCIYHRFEWANIFLKIYGHKPIYLLAEHKKNIISILPIIIVNSYLFGRVMISMPYFGFGGIIADNDEALSCLLKKATEIGRQCRAKYLELRQLGNGFNFLPQRPDKVLMMLDLAKTPEEQIRLLKPRLRNKVRNASKADFITQIGRDFKSFYYVYSQNMRHLGSPCHPQELFEAILETFPKNAFTINVFKSDAPVASAIALTHKGTIEIPCISSLREWNKDWANIKLYWSIIEYACNEGFNKFSFGRSSINSGTYNFKERWGAKAYELPYSYLSFTSNTKSYNCSPAGIGRKAAMNIWRKLPLSVTRYLGPKILHHLPSFF